MGIGNTRQSRTLLPGFDHGLTISVPAKDRAAMLPAVPVAVANRLIDADDGHVFSFWSKSLHNKYSQANHKNICHIVSIPPGYRLRIIKIEDLLTCASATMFLIYYMDILSTEAGRLHSSILTKLAATGIIILGCTKTPGTLVASTMTPNPTPSVAFDLTPAVLTLNVPSRYGVAEPFASTGSVALTGGTGALEGVTWSVDDPLVASVDRTGIIQALAVGKTVVRATRGATVLSTASLLVLDRGGVVRAQID